MEILRVLTVFTLLLPSESSKAQQPKSSDAAKAAADKEPRKPNRWASSIAWLIVLAVSMVYHYANERLVTQRELPVS